LAAAATTKPEVAVATLITVMGWKEATVMDTMMRSGIFIRATKKVTANFKYRSKAWNRASAQAVIRKYPLTLKNNASSVFKNAKFAS